MGKSFLENPIDKRAGKGADHYDEKGNDPAPGKGIHGAGTCTGHGPAESEDQSADHRSLIQGFGYDLYLLSIHRPHPEFSQQEIRQHSHRQGGADDAVHVKRLKPEHFLNAEPGDYLSLDEDETEKQSQYEKTQQLHKERIKGTTNQANNSPPEKKEMVATSDEKLRADNPVMVWPEVQPLA